MQNLGIRLIGHNPPGRSFSEFALVYVALHCESHPVDAIRGDVSPAVFDLDVDLVDDHHGGSDYLSVFVFGRKRRRFLTLAWGELKPGKTPQDNTFDVFRQSSIYLPRADHPDVQEAARDGNILQAEFSLTDQRGEPICQPLKPPKLRWRFVPSRHAATQQVPG